MKILLVVLAVTMLACSTPPGQKGRSGNVVCEVDEPTPENQPTAEEAAEEEIKATTRVPEGSYSSVGKALQSRSEASVIQEASKILSKDSKDIKALNSLAVVYIQNRKLDMAKIVLARAIKAHPNDPSVACNLGIVNLLEDKIPEAIVEFQRALSLDESHAEASYHLGAIHVKYKNHLMALPLLERAYLKLPKNFVGPHYAQALRLARKSKAAENVFEDIKAESSRDTGLVLNYASLLVEDLKEKKQGLKMINRIRLLTEEAAILKIADVLSVKAEALQ